MMYQGISIAGAILVLIGFAGLQFGRLDRESRAFNWLNLTGSALLAWVAIVDQRIGFIVLEVSWALFSIPPLLRRSPPPLG